MNAISSLSRRLSGFLDTALLCAVCIGCSGTGLIGSPSGTDGNEDCQNGILDPGESCENDTSRDCTTIAEQCISDDACRPVSVVGNEESCNLQCLSTTVTECVNDDGCCLGSCDGTSDNDCATACIDNDDDLYGDGCSLGADCNDDAALINPGAAEICDAVDNNCNSQTDEGGVCDGNVVLVTTDAEFDAAVDAVVPGDIVEIAPGIYDVDKGLRRSGVQGQPVIIRGADPQNRPVFRPAHPGGSNILKLSGSYMVLANIEFDGLGDQNGFSFGIAADGCSDHITLDNLYFHDFMPDNQGDAIKTHETWAWEIRNTVFERVGLGIYFGDSSGSRQTAGVLIEDSIFKDTVGYGMQIKHGNNPSVCGFPTDQLTIIRHNVFWKRGSAAGQYASAGGALARPNLLTGGTVDGHRYEIYGNLFYDNPVHPLVQLTGDVTAYANVFVNPNGGGLFLTSHAGHTVENAEVFGNTFVTTGGNGLGEAVSVQGNAFFSSDSQAGDNFQSSYVSASTYLNAPFGSLLSDDLDASPLPGQLSASWDIGQYSALTDHDRDIDGNMRAGGAYGAYE